MTSFARIAVAIAVLAFASRPDTSDNFEGDHPIVTPVATTSKRRKKK